MERLFSVWLITSFFLLSLYLKWTLPLAVRQTEKPVKLLIHLFQIFKVRKQKATKRRNCCIVYIMFQPYSCSDNRELITWKRNRSGLCIFVMELPERAQVPSAVVRESGAIQSWQCNIKLRKESHFKVW